MRVPGAWATASLLLCLVCLACGASAELVAGSPTGIAGAIEGRGALGMVVGVPRGLLQEEESEDGADVGSGDVDAIPTVEPDADAGEVTEESAPSEAAGAAIPSVDAGSLLGGGDASALLDLSDDGDTGEGGAPPSLAASARRPRARRSSRGGGPRKATSIWGTCVKNYQELPARKAKLPGGKLKCGGPHVDLPEFAVALHVGAGGGGGDRQAVAAAKKVAVGAEFLVTMDDPASVPSRVSAMGRTLKGGNDFVLRPTEGAIGQLRSFNKMAFASSAQFILLAAPEDVLAGGAVSAPWAEKALELLRGSKDLGFVAAGREGGKVPPSALLVRREAYVMLGGMSWSEACRGKDGQSPSQGAELTKRGAAVGWKTALLPPVQDGAGAKRHLLSQAEGAEWGEGPLGGDDLEGDVLWHFPHLDPELAPGARRRMLLAPSGLWEEAEGGAGAEVGVEGLEGGGNYSAAARHLTFSIFKGKGEGQEAAPAAPGGGGGEVVSAEPMGKPAPRRRARAPRASKARESKGPRRVGAAQQRKLGSKTVANCKASAKCPKGGVGSDGADVSFIIQYFKRRKTITAITSALKKVTSVATETIVNNDSKSEVAVWARGLRGMHGIIALCPNIHEIRGYNRLGQMAEGEVVVLLQDDDKPQPGSGWINQAIKLFNKYPKMGLIGGYRGRMDNGRKIKPNNCNDGLKYGADPRADPLRETKTIPYQDRSLGVTFMFIYKVNMAPMIVRKGVFVKQGMFNLAFSCPGDGGMGFDFEYSVRMWKEGYQVGIYDPKMAHRVGDSMKTGTHAGKANRVTRVNEKRNNGQIYKMYPGFHTRRGTAMAMRANRGLSRRGGRG